MGKTVSVITATYEDIDHLKEIAAGIKCQNYENLEYIVVDGGSKDGTVEYLKKLQAEFAAKEGWSLQWISEPDRGIYDAINKGIRMAGGEIIGMMFDRFASKDVLSRMVSAMEEADTDGVHGALDYVDERGRIVRRWRMGGEGSIQSGWMPAHPTLYLKKEIYDQYGLYRTDYKIAADYEFMVRILKDRRVRLSYIDSVLVHMFYGGTSTGGAGSYIRSFAESHRALRQNHVPLAFLICLRRTVKVLLQFGH